MRADRSRWHLTPSRLAALAIVWAAVLGFILLEVWPYRPKSFVGWLLLCIAGPPAYLALEWLGDRLAGSRLGGRSPPRVSPRRILIGTVVGVALVALVVLWAASLPR